MSWTPNGLNELQEKRFEFPLILIGKSTMTFLTGQPWHVLKSWYTAGGPEQRFQRCFADGLDHSLVSSAVQGIGALLFLELKNSCCNNAFCVLSYIDFTLKVDSFSGKETIECRAILFVFAINFLHGAM